MVSPLTSNDPSPTDPAQVAGQPTRVVVLASGSGTLLQAILDHQDERYRVVSVIADVPCEALQRAERAGIPAHRVALGEDRGEWNRRLADTVAAAAPDLVVSAGFMKILGPAFLDRFEGVTINTHPALLPSFPGAHAVRDALAYGVKVTGSTVHFVDGGVDTGRIIAQEAVAVHGSDDEATLHERIKSVERRLIVEVLRTAVVDKDTRKVHIDHE
ncbi:phosphoribosylglycinamide formyltransferase [Corynebacterium uterequi]|uniref:Phosphoribosylglycinamide formyltransferase n=1 Tax=Corynebacterium uterequi TaxID=1072256 RepID=A0A0G3HBC0_9CORY|nr:phosphoribosylglycinamide formyltransferase, formyltetrahydrofolate-dependent [Corynebacterium uterequi]